MNRSVYDIFVDWGFFVNLDCIDSIGFYRGGNAYISLISSKDLIYEISLDSVHGTLDPFFLFGRYIGVYVTWKD